MDNLAKLIYVSHYDKVTYYSIEIIESREHEITSPSTLFDEFIAENKINKEKLQHILDWIEEIGDKYGAKQQFFRNEKKASALPPDTQLPLEPYYYEQGKKKGNNLRLYCIRINEHVVILLNGGIKSTKKAQDCPNVSASFELANKLAKAIEKSLHKNDIEWSDEELDIFYDENLEINF